MDKLQLVEFMSQFNEDDWKKSIQDPLDNYLKELYNQIILKPLYTENHLDLSSLQIKKIELIVEEANSFLFSTKEYHQKGANPIQEIAFSLANLSDLLHTKNQDEIRQIMSNFRLEVFVDTDFFGSIAKIKAFKLLMPSVINEFIDDKNFEQEIDIQAVTSGKTIVKNAVELNLVRKTIEIIAAIIGGAEYIKVIPYDLSDEASSFSNSIFHLLESESNIKQLQNVINGSYFLEEFTKEIAMAAWNQFLLIENNGGFQEFKSNGEMEQELKSVRDCFIESLMIGDTKIIGYEIAEDIISKNETLIDDRFYYSQWIDKCLQLKGMSWDCIIFEGASDQEEDLIKNVLYSLHSIGLKNRIDAEVVFIAGDEKKINNFQKMNPFVKIIRVVEELNEDYQYAITSLAGLPYLIDALINDGV